MSDIFISYAREDKARVELLAEALQEKGWSVWWDPQIPIGKQYDQIIEDALRDAKCIIVVWSGNSVSSKYVRAEASEAADREILLPVMIEEVRIPLAFRQIQTARMVDWDGSQRHPEFGKLIKDIAGVIQTPPTSPEKKLDSSDVRLTPAVKSSSLASQASRHLSRVKEFSPRMQGILLGILVLLLIAIALWIYNLQPRQSTSSTAADLVTPRSSPTPQPSPSTRDQDSGSIANVSDLVKHVKVSTFAFYRGDCVSGIRPPEVLLHPATIDRADLSQTRWFIELVYPKATRRVDFSIVVRFYDSTETARGEMTHSDPYVNPDWDTSWHCSRPGLDRGGSLAAGSYVARVYIRDNPTKTDTQVYEVNIEVK